MDLWEERAARNEALFREVNERSQELANHYGDPKAELQPFVCECSDASCTQRLQVPLAVYEAVRANPRRFLIAPGHQNAYEHIVERQPGFLIVEKDAGAGQIAERHNPRR